MVMDRSTTKVCLLDLSLSLYNTRQSFKLNYLFSGIQCQTSVLMWDQPSGIVILTLFRFVCVPNLFIGNWHFQVECCRLGKLF